MSYSEGNRVRFWSHEVRSISEIDISDPESYIIIERVEEGYGLNVQKNIEIGKKFPIGHIWSWVEKNEFEGLASILNDNKNTTRVKNTVTTYTSPQRSKCLSVLGWPDNTHSLDALTEKLLEEKMFLRAAYFCVLRFNYSKATECIKPIKLQQRLLYSVLKSLKDEMNTNSINKLCLHFAKTATCVYSSTIFHFLSGSNDFSKIIEKIPFPDNFTFACLVMNDQDLKMYLRKLIEKYSNNGDLNGVVLTGFNSEGVEIMERYLNKTSDIQTIGLLSIYARFHAKNNEYKFSEWINDYKNKLNSLELLIYRTKLEIDEHRLFKSGKENVKLSKCAYCSKTLTNRPQNSDTWSEKDSGKKFISTCNNCPNTNLCCSVCILPYCNTSGNFSDWDRQTKEDWFVWCEKCNHGAHAEHLMMWFKDYKTCPVVGCLCKCEEIIQIR